MNSVSSPKLHDIPQVEVLSFHGNVSKRPQITTFDQAYRALLATWNLRRIDLIEQFKIILINQSNRLLGICEISSGRIASTQIDTNSSLRLL